MSARSSLWAYGAGVAAAAAALLTMLVVAVVTLTLGVGGASSQPSFGFAPSSAAVADIPPAYLNWYEAAGARYGIDWAVLAGIGKVECNHGRDPDPSCTVHGALNFAGAGGPMQFLPSTWRVYGVDVGGEGADMWDPADAIYGAARYLRASGAPANYSRAIFAYNHSSAYVALVLSYATLYRGAAVAGVAMVVGSTARITSSGTALAPADAPAAVADLIAAGNQIDSLPYPVPDVHYGPLSALWPAYDCSGATSYVLYRAGLAGVNAQVSGELESYGDPGPGSWITIYANSIHVFIEVAGIELNTVHPADAGAPGTGPRWLPASAIPGQIASDTDGGFVVRHPPGL